MAYQSPIRLNYSLFSGTMIIELVRNTIVPQVRPNPKEEHTKVKGLVLKSSAISETMSIGIDAPPRLPNSCRLYGTFSIGSFSFFTRRSTISLLA